MMCLALAVPTAEGKFCSASVEIFFTLALHHLSTSASLNIDAHLDPVPPREGRSQTDVLA